FLGCKSRSCTAPASLSQVPSLNRLGVDPQPPLRLPSASSDRPFRPPALTPRAKERSKLVMPGQSPRREPRPRRADRGNYRELIHVLNRASHLEGERAGRLEVELARARRWGLWPLFDVLRRFKRWLIPPMPDLTAGVLPWTYQPVIESTGRPHGRVSIIIPF